MEASSRHLMDAVVPVLLAAANPSFPVVTPKQRNVQPCVISRPPTLDEEMISDWAENCTLPERYHPLCEEASVFITAAQHAAARSIQRVVRGALAKLSFCRLRNAVISLQTTARGKFAKAKLQCLRLLEQVKATEQSKASLAEETLGSGGTPSQQVPKVASKVSQDLSLVKSSPKEVSLDPLSSEHDQLMHASVAETRTEAYPTLTSWRLRSSGLIRGNISGHPLYDGERIDVCPASPISNENLPEGYLLISRGNHTYRLGTSAYTERRRDKERLRGMRE